MNAWRTRTLAAFLMPLSAVAQQAASVNPLQQAKAAYEAKRFRESVGLYLRALPLVPESDRADVEYELACSQALAGESAAALDTLERAVDDGYIDGKGTEGDSDLYALRGDPRWQPLLERMAQLAAQQDARWGDAALAIPYAPNIGDADKLAGLAEFWAQAKFGFANFWHVPQLDWDATYREFIPRVLATRSTAEYYRVLQLFCARLQDGHTKVYPPEDLHVSPMPLRTRLVEGHLLVLGTDSVAFSLQGLHPGDEVLTIDGEPAIAWATTNVRPFISASTQQDRDNRTFGRDLFRAPEGTCFQITASTPAGERSNHTFTVPPWVASAHSLFELRMLPGNIAYVALNGFDDDTAATEWDKHWREIGGARSIILDMRENGGGDETVGDHILSTLIDRPVSRSLSRSTRWIATYRAWHRAENPLTFPVDAIDPDPARRFSGPVVLLTSARTFSAGEDMTAAFAQSHRGTIVGEPTGGSTGQPILFKLPGGGVGRVCTKHDSFADGREFVGVGIQPDIAAHLTRADIVAGHDSVLEMAIRSLQGKP